MNTTIPDLEPRFYARALYWQGFRIRRISEYLGIPETTISGWKVQNKWDDARPIDRVHAAAEVRMVQLINKNDKEGKDFKEIDLLGRQLERMARIARFEKTHNEVDLNPKVANRNSGPRRKPERNGITEQQQKEMVGAFHDNLFDYQRGWHKAGATERIRNILKSRQIGATWYFAREALVDAVETGRNQIFLSASKAQAHVFKQYITQFASEAADVVLTGDPIILNNGAHMYFLGTNARTAQSYHGNLYLDEYFWIHKFKEFRKVASGMAMHKKWRQTYISTPSSLTHEAYAFWAGTQYNRGRAKKEKIVFDLSVDALTPGMRCGDGQWRQIITVEEAVRGGCDLFDLDQLKNEYSTDEYRNLMMCEFIDDTASVFPMPMMQSCMVDSWEVWEDYKPFANRPLGNREVWIGYDPAKGSAGGDGAGIAAISPPATPGAKHRLIERMQLRGLDFEAQAKVIEEWTKKYNVTYIGIDITGIGEGVYQIVQKFFPNVTTFNYSPLVKGRLVMKAYDVISKGRFEFDAGMQDVAQAFMSIRKTTTTSGRAPTYEASRSDEVSHADVAWATMHALHHEPLDVAGAANTTSFLEIN